MKPLLLPSFLLVGFAAYAQPGADYRIKTYAESRREADSRAYNEAYLDDIRRQTNRSSGSGGVDNKAVQELVEQFRRNKARYVPPPLPELTPAEKKQREADRRKAAQEQEEKEKRIDARWEEGRRQAVEDNYRDLLAAGFEETDARTNARYYTNYADGSTRVDEAARKQISNAYMATKYFYENRNRLPFDSLLSLALVSYPFTATFFKLADELQQRFPGQKEAIELARLKSTCFLFETWAKGTHYFEYETPTASRNAGDYEYFLNFFANHFSDDVKVVASMLALCRQRETPFSLLAKRAALRDKEAGRLLYELLLMERFPIRNNAVPPYITGAVEEMHQFLPEFVGKLSPAYYRKFAAAQGITPANAVKILTKHGDIGSYLTRYYYGTDANNVFNDDLVPAVAAGFKGLADEGDPSACNAYAQYLLYHGRTDDARKPAVDYLQKGIAAGSIWSRLNLALEAARQTPGAPAFEQQKAELRTWFDTASANARANFLECFITPGVQEVNDPWFFAFAFNELKKLGEAGNTNVQKYLASPNSIFRYGTYTGPVKKAAWKEGLYTGPLRNGVPHGQGIWTAGNKTYEGEFKFGKREGEFWVSGGGEKKHKTFFLHDQ